MRIQLNTGVALTVIPVSQFKNTQISVHFLENASKKATSYRSLLANILETSSQRYSNQILVSQELSNLYGAGFGTSVMRKQTVHDLTFSLSLANNRYLENAENLLTNGVDFLKEMIFHPLVENKHFQERSFERQRSNLVAYIEALRDDKQSYAALQLQKLFFNQDEIQQIPAFGEADVIAKISNEALFQYYQTMLVSDPIEIYVVGNVDGNQVATLFTDWQLPSRQVRGIQIQPQIRPDKMTQIKTETQVIVQSKLDLAYRFPTDFRNPAYYAGIVFNALFGGSPLSKLFLNVREKASLAYYATSSIDVLNGLLVVQTGINAQDEDRVLAIINEQLRDIESGRFTDEDLEQIKTGLVSNYVASLDSERSYAARALTNSLVGSQVTAKEWLDGIQSVSRLEICEVAKKVQLQTVYFLSSEAKKHA